jgi:hypothetical protein
MPIRYVRLIAAVAILVGIVGNTGFVRAAPAAGPAASGQNLRPPRARQPAPFANKPLTSPPATPLGVQFIQVTTAANMSGADTVIDNPLTNGHPDAIILVTPTFNPGNVGGMYDDHPIGVLYNGSKWVIFNQDITLMAVGVAFNVIIPTAGANAFVHKATAGTIHGNRTDIDNPETNGSPNANVFVTPSYNPGGIGGTYEMHPIGVYYTGGKWTIFNQDASAMPVNAAFNVFVPPAGAGVFLQRATAGNSIHDFTQIDNPLTNGNPNTLVFVTPNYNPGGVGGKYENHLIGVFYTSGAWTIFNQDLAAVPANAAFNVLLLVPNVDVLVHTATNANSGGDHTSVDSRLTNSNPNAIALITQNYNPTGDCPCVGNNHNTGLYYVGNQWTIFNQDGATVPSGAAFNVIVPPSGANVFVHTARLVSGDYTLIDNPVTNGHPNALVFITPSYNPGGSGGTNDKHPIGVYYSVSQWAILNEDTVAMPLNAAFNVFVPPAGSSVFVHTATALNSSGDHTVIDNPLTNGHPNAIVFVTPNYDPGGVCPCAYVNHPIGVYYTHGQWAIFNQDVAAMPVNAAFNVAVYYKAALPFVTR